MPGSLRTAVQARVRHAGPAGEAAIRQLVTDAGFTRFRRSAEAPFNLVYEVRRSRLGPKSLGKPARFVVDHAACPVLLVWPEPAPDVATIPPPPHHPSPPGS